MPTAAAPRIQAALLGNGGPTHPGYSPVHPGALCRLLAASLATLAGGVASCYGAFRCCWVDAVEAVAVPCKRFLFALYDTAVVPLSALARVLVVAPLSACLGAAYEHCLRPAAAAVHRSVRTLAKHAWGGVKAGCSGLGSGLAHVDGLLTEGIFVTAGTLADWMRLSWRLIVRGYTAIESCLGGVCASPKLQPPPPPPR